MLNFENEQKFIDWLHEILRKEEAECLQSESCRQAWLEDVENQSRNICSGDFEYSFWFEVPGGYQTKSGNPECYLVEVKITEKTVDDFDTTIIF